jgi:DNA polymerase theta
MTAILGQLKACKSPPTLRQQVSTGVCHHHAGLTTDERELIEQGFRSSILRVLCATSTLSAGVNLPARLVVIHGSSDATNKRLTSTAYKQMAGRAGRYGHDVEGEAIVLVSSKAELEQARQLLASSATLVKAKDHQKSLERSVLDILATHQASSRQDVYSFASSSFGFRDAKRGEIEMAVNHHLQQLSTQGFLALGSQTLRATTLGIATATAALETDTALQVKRDLDCAQQHLTLDSELHLVYLSTPISSSVRINMEAWQQFHNRWSALSSPDRSVAATVGLSEGLIVSASQGILSHGRAREVATRFYAAMLLHQLIKDELSPSDLAWQFHIDRGALQRLQKDASSFAGMVTVFALHLGMDNLAMLLGQFQVRCIYPYADTILTTLHHAG